ncbi:MAG TPA: PDZ domain-containing protein [Pyrinomonadaceae bacterium]|nr:PDZ domain-containing protein [Pyrinomonadaceae bacterium]
MRSIRKSFLLISALLTVPGTAVLAQNPQTPPVPPVAQAPWVDAESEKSKAQKPIRRTARASRVTMVKNQEMVAPQVVTIIHRISGAKLLRYLLRQSGERGTATIEPDALTSDAHASIIAGWALEDGKTILARLPQVAAEMEVQRFTMVWAEKFAKDKQDKWDKATPPEMPEVPDVATVQGRAPQAPRMQPDLTVMMQDGKTFRVRYIGIDGQTGLSVLQLAGPAPTPITEVTAQKISAGETVRLFAPERVPEATPYTILVRIGQTDAKVAKAASPKAQMMDRVMLQATNLSPNVIGGVACDAAGRTLGIIDAIEGNNARLVTADAVRSAARRVLERQSSVPRPLLGIRGEAVDQAARKTWLAFGWDEQQFEDLLQKQIGILLTSVLPGTPAAFANLKPGDVIIRVGDKDVKSAEEFSTMLAQAGTGEQVRFFVQRPKSTAPVTFDVRLGGAYQPVFEWQFKMPDFTKIQGGLNTLGVEAMVLSPESVPKWRASGLLVVAIEPESAAARSGLKEGDVIESIDGRPIGHGGWAFGFKFKLQNKHVFSVVRAKERKQVVIGPVE